MTFRTIFTNYFSYDVLTQTFSYQKYILCINDLHELQIYKFLYEKFLNQTGSYSY